jgi:hypothetical protein
VSVVLLVVMASVPLSGAVCAVLCDRAPYDGSTDTRLVRGDSVPATSHHQHAPHPPATVEPAAPVAHHAATYLAGVSAGDCAGHDPAAWVASQAVGDRTVRDTLAPPPDISLATTSPVHPLGPSVRTVQADLRTRAATDPPATRRVLRV